MSLIIRKKMLVAAALVFAEYGDRPEDLLANEDAEEAWRVLEVAAIDYAEAQAGARDLGRAKTEEPPPPPKEKKPRKKRERRAAPTQTEIDHAIAAAARPDLDEEGVSSLVNGKAEA